MIPHFAKLDENNFVVAVYPGRKEDDGREGELSERTGDRYVQTEYGASGGKSVDGAEALRYNYAGIGWLFDESRNAFIPPKTHESWVLDETTCLWVAPVDMPDDGKEYRWDEDSTSWVEIVEAV